MLKYLLDTNIAIKVIKHKPPSAFPLFNTHARHSCISNIALSGLMHGA